MGGLEAPSANPTAAGFPFVSDVYGTSQGGVVQPFCARCTDKRQAHAGLSGYLPQNSMPRSDTTARRSPKPSCTAFAYQTLQAWPSFSARGITDPSACVYAALHVAKIAVEHTPVGSLGHHRGSHKVVVTDVYVGLLSIIPRQQSSFQCESHCVLSHFGLDAPVR